MSSGLPLYRRERSEGLSALISMTSGGNMEPCCRIRGAKRQRTFQPRCISGPDVVAALALPTPSARGARDLLDSLPQS